MSRLTDHRYLIENIKLINCLKFKLTFAVKSEQAITFLTRRPTIMSILVQVELVAVVDVGEPAVVVVVPVAPKGPRTKVIE